MPTTWNWTGKEGKAIRVVAFSNARRVELFLNEKSLGVQPIPKNGWVEWKVPYQPGRLTARAYAADRVVAKEIVETTGAASQVELSPDRKTMQASGQDALVVPVAILDAAGRVVPEANNRVSFELSGGGKIFGTGNGNPSDHDPDRANQRNAFHGHCIVIVQAGTRSGSLRLTANSPGLKPAVIDLQVKEHPVSD